MEKRKTNTSWLIPLVFAAFLSIFSGSGFSGQERQTPLLMPSLEMILKDLAAYDGGLNSEAFWRLRDFVQAAKDAPEARLACEAKLDAFLETNASPAAKMAVCRELRKIGGEKSVPVLKKMLALKETTDMARYALEKIPGAEADAALLEALRKTTGDIKTGIMTTLGQRKTKTAVAELARLVGGSNPEFSAAAAIALGRIGGSEAEGALTKSLGSSPKDLKTTIASALLLCAEEFMAAKNLETSFRIYDRILADNLPLAVRRAALRGKIASAGDEAKNLILGTLAGPDQEMHAPAIGLIKSVFSGPDLGSVCAALPKLPRASQVQLLSVLSEYPKDAVLPVLTQAAKSPDLDVRLAALKALEQTGDASLVPYLAETAARFLGAEQTAARNGLWGLKGKDIDDAILSLLMNQADEAVQAELILGVGERRIFAGKNLVMKFADSPSTKVRSQMLKTIKAIGTLSDIPGLLELLLKTESEAEQIVIEDTVTGLAQKMANPNGRSAAVRSKLDLEKDAKKRCLLYRILGKIGDDSSLSLLRGALQDLDPAVVDAAVRALAEWPTATARDDVFDIARDSKNDVHRVLAVRAYVRLAGQEKFRSPKAAVEDLEKALKLVSRPEEKKLILGVLPDFVCPEALKLASPLLNDPDVKEEANAALEKIRKRLEKKTS